MDQLPSGSQISQKMETGCKNLEAVWAVNRAFQSDSEKIEGYVLPPFIKR